MQNSTTDTTEASAHRRDSINRRALLAVAGAGIAGSVAAVDTARAAYAPSDQNLSFTCRRSSSGDVVVTASWTWKDGYSGEPPEDVAIIYWDDAEWEDAGEYRTTDGVRFRRRHREDGVQGVEFRHDDVSASRGTEYAASVWLRPRRNDSTVYLDYTHTYGDTEILEVNVGRDYDGRPTSEVRTSDDRKKWEKNRQLDASECGY
jgi:hypothetical protein